MPPLYYLSQEKWRSFLSLLEKDYQIYLPQITGEKGIPCEFGKGLPKADFKLAKYVSSKISELTFNPYRTIEPLKTFYTFPKEKLTSVDREERVAIIGIKNCDLFSLKIQDYVFLKGVVSDPFYKKRRENTLIISGDCSAFKEVCFCLGMEINPFPEEGFDLNLSFLDDGFLIESGSQKGEEIIEKGRDIFPLASAEKISLREKKREEIVRKLSEHINLHNLPPLKTLQKIVKEGFDSPIWQEEALRCVECGGCNFSCDTCHCFLLSEDRFGSAHEQVRLWDACLYANFAKVAGGANPLRYRYQRLRNRYLKKFDFFPENVGLVACCGCGRCIEVCPAKIDIRNVLRKLSIECGIERV
ncbi:MAG: 4Fe-4S dicluster domain-containing protein [Candidatus Omnitrophica bacterium]|nr:4Fe-4S dicluster domain-containing protein [Candidatus Omnitrophota bacterium]MCM8798210.1 4Fe-4S dicluster domain-containing protein [Candidatus Omnitrophota bacterium]